MSFPKFCVFYKKMSSPPQILVLYTCTFVTSVSCRHRRTVIFFSSRCDSIHAEKKAKKIPQG